MEGDETHPGATISAEIEGLFEPEEGDDITVLLLASINAESRKWVASMNSSLRLIEEWAFGKGEADRTFPSYTIEAEFLSRSAGFREARAFFYKKYQGDRETPIELMRVDNYDTRWLAIDSLGDWIDEDGYNPTLQYVGSFKINIRTDSEKDLLEFEAWNTSSFQSFVENVPGAPSWERETFGPGANTRQIFYWAEPIDHDRLGR